MRAPDFWETDRGLSRFLEPFGRIYGAITTARATRRNAPHANAPVISVGGVTMGGAGKTPVTASLTQRLMKRGLRPAVVLRGYGGHLKGPTLVVPSRHSSVDVGDEALLHAVQGPAYVARRRIEGVNLAAADGANVVLLDDGHQHPGLHKDYCILVLDGSHPFGNGFIFPAGPLREHPSDALARADAVVIVGEDTEQLADRLPPPITVLAADMIPDERAQALKGQTVVAFAGIARPSKFFTMLDGLGARVVARHRFEDHQPFGPADIQPILDEAFAVGAIPVTTEKDAVRLSPDQRQQVNVVSAAVRWRDEKAVERMLDRALSASDAPQPSSR